MIIGSNAMILNKATNPYYYNTFSEETVWKMPLAFRFFGSRVKEEEEDETDSDDD